MTEVPLKKATSLPREDRLILRARHPKRNSSINPTEVEVATETRRILEAFLIGELAKKRRRESGVDGSCCSSSAPSSVQLPRSSLFAPKVLTPMGLRKSTISPLPEVSHECDSSIASGSRPQSMELGSRRTSTTSRDICSPQGIFLHEDQESEAKDDQTAKTLDSLTSSQSPPASSAESASMSDEDSASAAPPDVRLRPKKSRFKRVRERLEQTFKRPNSLIRKKKVKKRQTFTGASGHQSLPEGAILSLDRASQHGSPFTQTDSASDNRLTRSVSDSDRKIFAAKQILEKAKTGRVAPKNRRQRKRSMIERIGTAFHGLKKDASEPTPEIGGTARRPTNLPMKKRGLLNGLSGSWNKIRDLAHSGSSSGLNSIQNLDDGTASGAVHKSSVDRSALISHQPTDLFSPSRGVDLLELSDQSRPEHQGSDKKKDELIPNGQESISKGPFSGLSWESKDLLMIDQTAPELAIKSLEEKLEMIADRLAVIGDEYMEKRGTRQDLQGQGTKVGEVNPGETELILRPGDPDIYRYCLDQTDEPSGKAPEMDVFEALSQAGNQEEFANIVRDVLPNEERLTQLAMTFYLTSFAVKLVGVGTKKAVQLKDYCTSFIGEDFAEWIASQGGWMKAVEDSSCSDLD